MEQLKYHSSLPQATTPEKASFFNLQSHLELIHENANNTTLRCGVKINTSTASKQKTT
jgi:hypothetical protein